ncbi:hypothetical protein PSCICO_09430 [Pseudomonas cichorii]|nr:hypothetical protein PSCICO_09430 [Pseudomonas cichorii]
MTDKDTPDVSMRTDQASQLREEADGYGLRVQADVFSAREPYQQNYVSLKPLKPMMIRSQRRRT